MQEVETLNNEPKPETNQVLKYGINDLIKMPPFAEAVIVNIEVKASKEVFGDKASKPEQKVLVISYENSELGIKNNEIYNHYPVGKVPEKSKLGRFIAKYASLSIGVKINLLQKTSGYYSIVID